MFSVLVLVFEQVCFQAVLRTFGRIALVVLLDHHLHQLHSAVRLRSQVCLQRYWDLEIEGLGYHQSLEELEEWKYRHQVDHLED